MFLFGVNPRTKPIAESFISTKEIVNAFSFQITECKNPAQNYGHSFIFLSDYTPQEAARSLGKYALLQGYTRRNTYNQLQAKPDNGKHR